MTPPADLVDAAGVEGAASPAGATPAAAASAEAAEAAASLHPALWRASQVGRPREVVWASGFAALDEALPGGGWPASALTELLLPHPGVGELRLLAPVLERLQREQQERCVMWFDPPAQPCAWALQALGLASARMVVVRSPAWKACGARRARAPSSPQGSNAAVASASGSGSASGSASGSSAGPASLWALEHALRSGHVGAVLAWLPSRLPADALRRLQLAAQGHEGPAFLLRDEAVAPQPSPAPLRLRLSAAAPDWLRVEVFKRRGPPLHEPLLLELQPVLGHPARLRAQAGVRLAGEGGLPLDAAPNHQPQGSWA